MKYSRSKPVVALLVGHYLPGFKAGGILRTVANTVEILSQDLDFRIITRDRDLHESKPYPGVERDRWCAVGLAQVFYAQPHQVSLNYVSRLIRTISPDLIYLNGYFEALTIWALLGRKLGLVPRVPVIVASRGEFAKESLGQKYMKKYLFILVAKALRLYADVSWHAASEYESKDMIRILGIKADAIHTVLDLSTSVDSAESEYPKQSDDSENGHLRIIFLSRIAEGKNLDYALKILRTVRAVVHFDIYGTLENKAYWRRCQVAIGTLPSNIVVRYLGFVNPPEVVKTFGRYDLFLFPTAGESYGHVIAESLMAGTPVLTSTRTPWRDLRAQGLGWDIDLDHIESFVDVIEQCARDGTSSQVTHRSMIRSKAISLLSDPALREANLDIFLGALKSPRG
jgi:glycosyltransferase involved in cell wall biosynthesis